MVFNLQLQQLCRTNEICYLKKAGLCRGTESFPTHLQICLVLFVSFEFSEKESGGNVQGGALAVGAADR